MSAEFSIISIAAEAGLTPEELLKKLAEQIKGHHNKIVKRLRATLESAREAGLALAKAKGLIQANGFRWLRWLRTNRKLSPRQAQKYVQFAEGYPALLERCRDLSGLTLNEALKRIARGCSGTATPRAITPPAPPAHPEALTCPSEHELHTEMHVAGRLVATQQIRFAEDNQEGRFVRVKAAALIAQVRKLAARLGAAQGAGGPVKAIHFAIAVVNRLIEELRTAAVVTVEESKPAPAAGATVVGVEPRLELPPPPQLQQVPVEPPAPAEVATSTSADAGPVNWLTAGFEKTNGHQPVAP